MCLIIPAHLLKECPLTGVKSPRFQYSASKVARLQVHATTPGSKSFRSVYSRSGEDILEVNEKSHKVGGMPFLVTHHPCPNFLSNTEIKENKKSEGKLVLRHTIRPILYTT